MKRGWRYRLVSVIGVVMLTVVVVLVTNVRSVHDAFDLVPYFGRPAPEPLVSGELPVAVVTTLVIVLAAMWPLFKPRPRRILDTVLLTQKRVFLAMIGLAALGYFNYSYRLPRTSLMLTTLALLAVLPLFMVLIRRRPATNTRAVVIGDDPTAMEALLGATDTTVLGYVSPPSAYAPDGFDAQGIEMADGGQVTSELDALPCLGGLARLEEAFVKHDVDTALLAFAGTDREEFFGTLEVCYENGVTVFVHSDHAEHVLTDGFAGTGLLEVNFEPWDWQDYAVKRVFDVLFAGMALLVLSPVILLITLAIALEDGAPVLYRQERTATFGTTFTVYKFRSMTSGEADCRPDSGETHRVTRVGGILRATHLDEIPQLWTILTGQMSVVGPRAVWTDEETYLEAEAVTWRKRWFIKPGLTGLAQINDATSAEATDKLRYDLQYIRQQSFWFDLKIVVRQLWLVGSDAVLLLVGESSAEQSGSEQEAGPALTDGNGVGNEDSGDRTEESIRANDPGSKP